MLRWLPLFLLLPVLVARAEDRAQKLAAAGVAEFAASYQVWDGACFRAAAELFRQPSTNTPTSATYYYWLGAARFHQMLQLQTLFSGRTNRLAGDAAMDAALAACSSAVKLEERHAESHALVGTLYGMKVDGNSVRGAQFGPRLQKHRKQALAFGAENQFVHYLLGTCQFQTAENPPAQREALTRLLAADKLLVSEARRPAGPLDPRWGHPTCLTCTGRTCESVGERIKSAHYFSQALTRQPTDHLSKKGLARVMEKK